MTGVDWLEILSWWLVYDSEPPPLVAGIITCGVETVSDCWLELNCDDELDSPPPPPIMIGTPPDD